MSVPVTVGTTERSFSKLKLIKNFLRSSMSQERLSDLTLLSTEKEQAKNLDFRKVTQQCWAETFQVSNHPQVNYGSLLDWLQRIVFY